MSCDRYRPLLALLVGNDLDSREAAEVRQHLSDCSCCQATWAGLQNAVGVLQLVSQQTVVPESSSLRKQVLRRLNSQPTIAAEPAPGWLTLGAFSAACVAVLWLTVSTPVFDFNFSDPQMAEMDMTSPLPTARANAEQYPQLQLVGTNSRQYVADESDRQSVQVSPRLFGRPRSF